MTEYEAQARAIREKTARLKALRLAKQAQAQTEEPSTKPAKRRVARPWTSVQVRDLKSLAKKKVPAKRIAKTLKRTEGATRQKAFTLGVSLDSRG